MATKPHQLKPGSQQWHEARARGIGGSEWVHILNDKYGCARQLWYQKTGHLQDFPKESPDVFWIGHAIEEGAASEIERLTGRTVRRAGRLAELPAGLRLPGWWFGDPDRMIAAGPVIQLPHPWANTILPDSTGLLEIKSRTPWLWRQAKYSGLDLATQAQVHHYMVLTGWAWALIATVNRDPGKNEQGILLHLVERNEGTVQLMLKAGSQFWAHVEAGSDSEGPARLDTIDNRCQQCPWRRSCLAEKLYAVPGDVTKPDVELLEDSALEDLIVRRTRLKELEDDTEKAVDILNDQIKFHLGEKPRKVQLASGARAYIIDSLTERIDSKRFKAEHPALAAQYSKTSRSKQLRIYPA